MMKAPQLDAALKHLHKKCETDLSCDLETLVKLQFGVLTRRDFAALHYNTRHPPVT